MVRDTARRIVLRHFLPRGKMNAVNDNDRPG